MSEILDVTNTLSADKVADTDNLLDVYKAGKEREKPKKPKKKTHTFLIISILLLFFLIGAILFIFTRARAMKTATSDPQFESMLEN